MNEVERGELRGTAQRMVPPYPGWNASLKEMSQEEDPVDETEEERTKSETWWCDVPIKTNWRHGRMIRRDWYHEISSAESSKRKA